MEQGDRDDTEIGRELRRAVSRALAEDLGGAGDITSAAVIPPGTTATGRIVAREPGVVSGVEVVAATYAQLDGRVEVQARVRDGESVAGGQTLVEVTGPLRSLLTGERVMLNLLSHLCGVATLTRRFVDRVGDVDCEVRDTRKTTPGLRALEKAAVRAGGGTNHRMGLHDALLVKDNHVAAAGGVGAAARAALDRADGRPVQVEVEDLDQLDAVLEAGVTDALLDNFTLDGLRAAVERAGGRARLEASGGIDLETVAAVAATGVDRVAVGALTHSAPALDVAMDIATSDIEVPAAFRRTRRDGRPRRDDAGPFEGDGTGLFEDDDSLDAGPDPALDDEEIFSDDALATDAVRDPDGPVAHDRGADDPEPTDDDGTEDREPVDDDGAEPLSELFAEHRGGDG